MLCLKEQEKTEDRTITYGTMTGPLIEAIENKE